MGSLFYISLFFILFLAVCIFDVFCYLVSAELGVIDIGCRNRAKDCAVLA